MLCFDCRCLASPPILTINQFSLTQELAATNLKPGNEMTMLLMMMMVMKKGDTKNEINVIVSIERDDKTA